MRYGFYTGSYGEAGEEGILRFCLDTREGTLEKEYGYGGIVHPSYLCIHREKAMLYAVQEQVPEGRIHALRIGKKGLEKAGSLSSRGADPCHLMLASSGKLLYVANYTSGSLGAVALDEEGIPVGMTDFKQHEGRGRDAKRQERAHVHFLKENGGRLFVCDLGLDRVFLYRGQPLLQEGVLTLPPGRGPRPLELAPGHSDMVYVLCELSSQVAAFRKTGTGYELVQSLSALPEEFSGESTAAAIKCSGDLLFASNRGHDSIAVFRILEDGTLKRTGIFGTGGRTPRDFALFGDYLVAANQDSDLLTVLKLCRESGALELTDIRASAVRPCCVLSE